VVHGLKGGKTHSKKGRNAKQSKPPLGGKRRVVEGEGGNQREEAVFKAAKRAREGKKKEGGVGDVRWGSTGGGGPVVDVKRGKIL